ncbi:hypothetical protein D9756_005546 [Leucocoprinus leucothites]|uniref:Uncharacterized protein n=1 Tax=Leucocoprinus leucothites TaxID=201217 RepID=A0A8H5D7T0_9AGAR|nr:hypothetical protein D9756_005546 [Leucoagaricus leucothites]
MIQDAGVPGVQTGKCAEREDQQCRTAKADQVVSKAEDAGLVYEKDPAIGSVVYPEGGLRAWGVVFGAFLTQFCSYGYLNSFGVYQDYYTRVYMTTYSPSIISWIGSLNGFLIISTGLVGGRLYDRGHCLFLLYGGAFLVIVSLFVLSFAKPNQLYLAFICQGIGVGLGGGMTYVPSLAIVSHYFDKRRSLATSIVTAGSSLGSTVTPIMINNLIAKPGLGFATVTRIHAGLITAILLVGCILMRPRLPPAENHQNLKQCLRKFSKDWAYIVLTAGFALFNWGFFFPIFYLQLAATTHGLDKTFAFYSLVILNACSSVGRISCGLATRATKIEHLAVASAIGCGTIIFAFLSIESAASIVLIGVFYGFFSGVFVAAMAPMTSLVTDDVAELGIRLGISFACSGLGDLTGPPIIGALLTEEYHWWRPAIFAGVNVLAAGVCFGAVGMMVGGRGK